jgi:hypothetical protein
MSNYNRQTPETQPLQETIIINAIVNPVPQIGKIARICWNTGEEKNCPACYLSKGCKAKG